MIEKSISRREFLKMVTVGGLSIVTGLSSAFNYEEGQKEIVRPPEILNDPTKWKEWPIVPEYIDPKLKDIYYQGISTGKSNPHVFSKAGDCQNVPSYLFGSFDQPGEYNLGGHGDLEKVVKWFEGSWSYFPPTIHGGLSIPGILVEDSIMKYDNNHQKECLSTQSFLDCEIEKRKPSLLLISFEQEPKSNDIYKEYLDTVVKLALDKNIVPIVTTCANSEKINEKVAEVAVENGIPTWNFWRAVQPLNNIFDPGLNDDFHLSYNGKNESFDFNNTNPTAWNIRNLTGVQTINAVLKMLNPNF